MPTLRDGPYAGFNFAVEFDGGEDIRFQQVSGLSIDVDVIEYRDGADRVNTVRRYPGLHRVREISLKHGMMGAGQLFQWMQSVSLGNPEPRTVVIRLMTENRDSVPAYWTLRRCWPIRYGCGPFDAMKSTILVEELVLTAESLELA